MVGHWSWLDSTLQWRHMENFPRLAGAGSESNGKTQKNIKKWEENRIRVKTKIIKMRKLLQSKVKWEKIQWKHIEKIFSFAEEESKNIEKGQKIIKSGEENRNKVKTKITKMRKLLQNKIERKNSMEIHGKFFRFEGTRSKSTGKN